MVENGHFTWGDHESKAVLKNINLQIPRGFLVAVVGGVGSGKTSLLSALLGDMDKLSGRVNIKGSNQLSQEDDLLIILLYYDTNKTLLALQATLRTFLNRLGFKMLHYKTTSYSINHLTKTSIIK